MWTWLRRRRRSTPELPPAVVRQWRDWEEWRPTSPRARTVIVVLAIAMAGGVLMAMLQPQLRLLRAQADAASATAPRTPAPHARGCGEPGDAACPGDKLDVFVLPAEPAPRR